MGILPIFDIEDDFFTHLWTSKYKAHITEFDETFKNWADPTYLENFFITNKVDLMSGFYDFKSIEDAILKTQKLALEIEEKLLYAADNNVSIFEINDELEELFKPLYKSDEFVEIEIQKTKTKIKGQKWLRLYAIKLKPSCYIIVANAIKLTKKMDREKDHFKLVFEKYNKTLKFIQSKKYKTFDDLITN